MPIVSVIVPVYNVEKYLKRSIESLINQTLEDIEIILINDGSKDNSLYICKEYERKDSRIHTINKTNGGVSTARNIGLEKAQGEYIVFVDSDDYVELTMIESMYKKIMQMQGDMCICNYIVDDTDKMTYAKSILEEEKIYKEDIENRIIPCMIAPEEVNGAGGMGGLKSPWGYLYRKSIIDKNKIRFIEGMPIGEDFLFNLKYMNKINSIVIDRGHYYHYCKNDDSAMVKYRNNWWEIHKELIVRIEEMIKDKQYYTNLNKRLDVMKINYLVEAIINEGRKSNSKPLKDKINNLKAIYKDPCLNEAIKRYKGSNLSIGRKIWLSFIKTGQVSILYWIYKVKLNIKI